MKTKKEVKQFINDELLTRADELADYLIEQGELITPEIA